MPVTTQAVTIILLVLAPGYICLWVARQAIKQVTKQSDTEFLISTVAIGTFIHVLLFPWPGKRILGFYRENSLLEHNWWVGLWGIGAVLIVPVALGLVVGWFINRFPHRLGPIGLDPLSRIAHAWDYVMRRSKGYYVRVFMKDGSLIGGGYLPGSFASSDRDRSDLFLAELWELDDAGRFIHPVPGNGGVWIAHDSISRIEFEKGKGDD